MLTVISAGLTAEEIILNGISKAADVAGGGRHMSNHFTKPEWHIQNIEAVLITLPGLRVVYPAFADDAAGLLRTAIRSKGLTLFLETKAMYNDPSGEAVVPDDFEVPFGKARVYCSGNDLPIISYGNTVPMCVQVAKQLEKKTGKSIEVIDICSLISFDEEAILPDTEKLPLR